MDGTLQTLLSLVAVGSLTWAYFTLRRPHGYPPGPWFIPIFGSLPFLGGFGTDMLDIFNSLRRKYGDVMAFKFGPRWYVLVNGVDHVREALVTRGNAFAGRPYGNYELNKLIRLDRKLGIIDGSADEQWKLQRHTSMMILRHLGYGKNSLQQKIATEAEELCKALTTEQGRPFDPNDYVSNAVANVIVSLLFGERYQYDDEEFLNMRHVIDELFGFYANDYEINFIPLLHYLPKYKRILRELPIAVAKMNTFLQKKIDERRTELDSSDHLTADEDIPDFVYGYLQEVKKHNGKLDDRSLAVVTDFFQAGLETTATTLGWALYYMACYPEVQTKIQTEMESVLGSGVRPSLSDRERLPYTEAALWELLRISVTGPFGVEHEAMEDSEIAGYRIPKGTIVTCSLWSILMDPEIFPNPTCFRPERFLDANGQFVRPTDVVAFGLGRRACMGEQLARHELFLIFTHMVQQFTIRPQEGVAWPEAIGTVALTRRPPPFKITMSSRL